MVKTKSKEIDTQTQRQKFIDKARELETDDRPETFDRTLTALAKAPVTIPKKATKKKR